MKKVFAAALLSLSAPAWSLCPYPLDATQALLDRWPDKHEYQLPPSVVGETMAFTVQPATPLFAYAGLSDTGLQAMIDANITNTPQGDVTLPSSGTVHVRMRINDFPFGELQGNDAGVFLGVAISSGNLSTPQPKESLSLNIVLINDKFFVPHTGSRLNLQINGQSISQSAPFSEVNQYDPMPLPFPADVVGMWINMDTREIGLSARLLDGNPLGLPAGDYDFPTIHDKQGQPYKVPAGVDQISLGLYGSLVNIASDEPLLGAPVSATLETDVCGSRGPAPLKLPNGELFPGQGKAKGLQKFQSLPLGTAPLGQLLKAAK